MRRALAAMAVAALCVGTADAVVILSETFSGSSAVNLVGTTTPDGNNWVGAGNTKYKQDGSVPATGSGWAVSIPFTFSPGLIYTLEVDLNVDPAAGSNWMAAGFCVGSSSGGGWYNDGAAKYGWVGYRGNGAAIPFKGPGPSGGLAGYSYVGNTATIVLDTTDTGNYTIEFRDESGTRVAPTAIGTPAINGIALFHDGSVDMGSFDNLTLSDNTVIPEPATLSVMGLAGLALVLRRRRIG